MAEKVKGKKASRAPKADDKYVAYKRETPPRLSRTAPAHGRS